MNAQATVYTDFQGLSALKLDARKESPEALRAAAKQFEALFLQMMLKSMREASEGDPLFDGDHSDLYRDMYDKQLSLEMSERGVGLADQLVRQLQQQAGEQVAPMQLVSPVRPTLPSAPNVATAADSVRVPAVDADKISASPKDFVAQLMPLAEKAAARIGVAPEALLAQAALETGWGKSVIRRHDGGSSHNLFNIKADGRWDGERVGKNTLEYRNGVAAKEQAQFRAYGSFAESFDDYVNFLQANPRYDEALRQTDNPKAFARALQDAGYATDPAYASKIEQILDRDTIREVALNLKNTTGRTLS